MRMTRRGLLAGAAGMGLLRPATTAGAALFEEVPAETSGITWVHDNAMSDQRFLPETMGPGCAFLDYDNDGWMDIFLVNSGPSRFLHAEEADPQCAVQEQSRRHVYGCDREGRGWPADRSGWAWRWAITTTTAGPIFS